MVGENFTRRVGLGVVDNEFLRKRCRGPQEDATRELTSRCGCDTQTEVGRGGDETGDTMLLDAAIVEEAQQGQHPMDIIGEGGMKHVLDSIC